MKKIIRIALYSFWTILQFILLIYIICSYPYEKIKHKFKPNLNDRPFRFTTQLHKRFTSWFDKKFKNHI